MVSSNINMKNRYVRVAALLTAIALFPHSQAVACPTITIEAPSDGTVFEPGAVMTVRVDVQPQTDVVGVVVSIPGYAPMAGMAVTPPYAIPVNLPRTRGGDLRFEVLVRQSGGQLCASQPMRVTIRPPVPPTSLQVVPDRLMLQAGDKVQLHVSATR